MISLRRYPLLVLLLACDPEGPPPGKTTPTTTPTPVWECLLPVGSVGIDSAPQIGCWDDFLALASQPLDASIAGAQSIKTVIDRSDNHRLYFMNSRCYPIHWDFASEFLSGNGLPPVPDLATFNSIEYYSPERRFLLGSLTHYEGSDAYSYELSPYDTADAEMITSAYRLIRDNTYFGDSLTFHPTSTAIEAVLPEVGEDVVIITTDELFAGVTYQPYNLGEAPGQLAFYDADEVAGAYVPYRQLVVLDDVPIDIGITAGIITAAFQTPLAHINVLSVNRGTPNMGLKGATEDPVLRALEGKWVHLKVDAFDYTITEITQEEAESWWEEHKPDPLTVPSLDLTVTDLRDVESIIADDADLATEIDIGLTRFGSKGTNYAALYDIDPELVPIQDAFVIPFYHYHTFMEDNGFWDQMRALMADPSWGDPEFREEQLLLFQEDLRGGILDPDLVTDVMSLFASRFPDERYIRFRSSTNAEDLGTFTGAGLYNSQTGDTLLVQGVEDSVEWAIKEAWLNIWNPRAYEERGYYSIDQLACAMALLTTPNFEEEEANGVAVTANIFDTSGLEPAFFVNVQPDNEEVVQPEPGDLPDSYLHYFYLPGQPVTYITHSTHIDEGETVLEDDQIYALGVALDQIHNWFMPVYGDDGWYGMDVEFKFDDKLTPGTEALFVKQARPFPWTPGSSDIEGNGECDDAE